MSCAGLRRGGVPAVLGSLIAAFLALGCQAKPPRNVVLIVIDTLRADHLGVYGYVRPTSPRIDAFAREATTFEQAQTPAPWTLPAVASLMTGLYPTVHGARGGGKMRGGVLLPESPVNVLGESQTTLAESLRDAGFATFAFTQSWYAGGVFGFDQGFDSFSDRATPGLRFDVEGALRWLDEHDPDRFFLYLHTTDVHAPYAPKEAPKRDVAPKEDGAGEALAEERARFLSVDFDPGYRGKVDGSLEMVKFLTGSPQAATPRDVGHLAALYDRGIAYTDHWLGVLFDGLAERGHWDDTLIVFTADHGEEFREHGNFQHSKTFFDEVIRVPLIVRLPGVGSGLRVSQPVSLVDVLPTVLDAVGVEFQQAIQGRSLLPLLRGGALPERPLYGEAGHWQAHALRLGTHKLVQYWNGRRLLFDLAADPRERTDRCAAEPTTCARLAQAMDAFAAELEAARDASPAHPAPEVALDPETREALQALGYLDDEATPDDPYRDCRPHCR